MRFSPHILDEIRARLSVSQVVSRKVALKKKGREYAGLSPFKTEKTPSFFVNDHKGFYHCFASGEHGDIFTFLMKTEGLTFPEAIERLAAEAGVTLPKADAHDVERESTHARLASLMDRAAQIFEAQLKGTQGADARRYIEKRGLTAETLREFRIGYALNSRSALKDALTKAGFTADEMIASGMLIAGDDIPVPYDRFRNRVMFPICDARGRIIAFGGRALDPEQSAKYLNSPETTLFHKGHVLFNAHRARPAAHDTERVIAVEGYMDVITLYQAGFKEAVAPLGTALTEDQLALLWRMSPEPILCFDGDGAGKRAAFRAVDTALPHLKPGASLMFAFLPDGLDPDDLIRQQGARALDTILGQSRPLSDVLFEREWAGRDWSTPERRAGLEQHLKQLMSRIEDESVRSYYKRDLATRLAEAWGPATPYDPRRQPARAPNDRSGKDATSWRSQGLTASSRYGQQPGRGGKRFTPNTPYAIPERANASYSLRKSAMVSGSSTQPSRREALLMRAILNHPWLLEEYSEPIAALPLTHPSLTILRDAMLSATALDISLDRETLRSHLNKMGAGSVLTIVERAVSHKCDKFAEPEAGRTEVDNGWRHALAMHERHVGLKQSLAAAEQAWHEDRNEAAYARICELQRELEQISAAEHFDAPAGH